MKYRIKEIPWVFEGKFVINYQIQFSFFGLIWFNKHLDWWGNNACFLHLDDVKKCLDTFKNNKIWT